MIAFPGGDGWRLLEALAESSLKYGRADPPPRLAEEIAQDAGLAVVGQPDTRMAMAMRELAGLREVGCVQRVKGADPDERMAYRLTVRGARALWEREKEGIVRGFEKQLEHVRAGRQEEYEKRLHVERLLAELVGWASSWRRRVFTRMPR